MKFLNLASGPDPTQGPWIHIDKSSGKRSNFIQHDLLQGIPFADNSVNGLFCSHFLEHLDAIEALKFMKECYRVLKPCGILRLSVPDAEKFYHLTVNNCQNWGEPNGGAQYVPPKDFMSWALFFEQHKQILSKSCLLCYCYAAGFAASQEMPFGQSQLLGLADLDNRPIFSTFVEARK